MIARGLEAGAADREGDLGPVSGLVEQAVEEQLARREDELAAVLHREICDGAGLVVEFRDELIPAPGAPRLRSRTAAARARPLNPVWLSGGALA